MPDTNGQNEDFELRARQNTRTALIVFSIVFGMVGLSFASVPLYNLFCRVTGFGGTTQVSEQAPDTILERTVKINFNADTNPSLPWQFHPGERDLTVHVGQKGITHYVSTNNADYPVTGTAIYNVTPPKVGKYFHKIQCFCFDEQTLQANESVRMPVLFYVDPKFDADPDMKDVNVITLSYTFFKADTQELEQAIEAF